MPIYDFVCRDCRQEFEILLRSAETPQCASCGGKHLDKLLSVPATPRGGQNVTEPRGGMPMGQSPCGGGGCGLPECG